MPLPPRSMPIVHGCVIIVLLFSYSPGLRGNLFVIFNTSIFIKRFLYRVIDDYWNLCFTSHMANNTIALGKRSQEESSRTQERILDEAEKLFARYGLGISVREIAKASGVHHHTIQHHFTSKEVLYKAVLNRWDNEIEQRVLTAITDKSSFAEVIDAAIEVIFDFFLERRSWVALTTLAAMDNEPHNQGLLRERSWIQFIESTMENLNLGMLNVDPGLLLITVEGIMQNHVLASAHYKAIYGKDVTDSRLKKKTKQHLKTVVRALMGV